MAHSRALKQILRGDINTHMNKQMRDLFWKHKKGGGKAPSISTFYKKKSKT